MGYPQQMQQQGMYPMGMVGSGQQQHASYYQPAAGMGYMPAMQMQQFEQPKVGEAQQGGQLPGMAPSPPVYPMASAMPTTELPGQRGT